MSALPAMLQSKMVHPDLPQQYSTKTDQKIPSAQFTEICQYLMFPHINHSAGDNNFDL